VTDSQGIPAGYHSVGELLPIEVSGYESKGLIDSFECREDQIFSFGGGGEISIEVPVGDVLSRKECREKKQY
jgi:hypothetical protein